MEQDSSLSIKSDYFDDKLNGGNSNPEPPKNTVKGFTKLFSTVSLLFAVFPFCGSVAILAWPKFWMTFGINPVEQVSMHQDWMLSNMNSLD